VAYRLDVGEAYVSKLGGHRASRRLRLAVLRRDRACEGIDSLERRRIARLAHAGECLLERMRISSDLGESEHPRLALHRVELAESVGPRSAGRALRRSGPNPSEALDRERVELGYQCRSTVHQPRCSSWKPRTSSSSCSAWAFKLSAAMRVCVVAAEAGFRTLAMSRTLADTASVALRCCCVTCVIRRAASLVLSTSLRLWSVAITVAAPDALISP